MSSLERGTRTKPVSMVQYIVKMMQHPPQWEPDLVRTFRGVAYQFGVGIGRNSLRESCLVGLYTGQRK